MNRNGTHNGLNLYINFAVDANGDFDRSNFRGTLGWILGFRNVSYTVHFESTVNIAVSGALSEAVADLNIFKYLYVTLDEYVTGRRNGNFSILGMSLSNNNILAKVQMNPSETMTIASVEKGNLVTDMRQYETKTTLNRLTISLVRDNGDIVDLHGIDISMSLFIEA
jgi:hypothetical protein